MTCIATENARHDARLPDRTRAEDPADLPDGRALRQDPDARVSHARRHGRARRDPSRPGSSSSPSASTRTRRCPTTGPECSPLDVPLHALPPVTKERCAAFIAAAEKYLRKVGGYSTADRREIEREGRKAAGLKRNQAPSRELVEESRRPHPQRRPALRRLDQRSDSRSTPRSVLTAATCGRAGRRGADKKRSGIHRREMGAASRPSAGVTVGTLFWLARQERLARRNGWSGLRTSRAS